MILPEDKERSPANHIRSHHQVIKAGCKSTAYILKVESMAAFIFELKQKKLVVLVDIIYMLIITATLYQRKK
jgi:hypothetical protein